VPSFPALKTGVVAQYPSDRRREFSTTVLRFVDGSEQRFPGFGAVLRRWVIRLDLLDESELVALEQFFESQGGRAASFSFTDPFDAVVYASCSFDGDQLTSQYRELGAAVLVVKENRS
jgi:phage-related protein